LARQVRRRRFATHCRPRLGPLACVKRLQIQDRADAWIASPQSRSCSRDYLIGREPELEQLDSLLERVRAGSGALLVNGEAGIGKSALLERARDRATELGARALVAVGVESEAELAFAGMHQLLRPIVSTVELLPSPQRRALEAAFGIASDATPDPFLVALAAHQLVCDAAEVCPLALIVDDAH
jgi:AAA ATPase domain